MAKDHDWRCGLSWKNTAVSLQEGRMGGAPKAKSWRPSDILEAHIQADAFLQSSRRVSPPLGRARCRLNRP